ncbi:hypothetical protein [Desulfovibrio sp. Huiquan2017]|uniref:hypothetical protein n=1 Tax=Desulfovibrio sp. Huiquan2017 TaxID=2816861 RepID=UPI001A927DB6|nr:hypothetical protein [Desulfovibrio sp. Huiquan2017]
MPRKTGPERWFPVVFFALLFFFAATAGLVYFQTDLFRGHASGYGLSGLVSVRGSVPLEQLALTDQEIGIINRTVQKYHDTFIRMDLVVDTLDDVDKITPKTILVFAVELQTKGDLVVKSWNRKVPRGKMIPQIAAYVDKAAREYGEFKRFPDVKQNFKTLYI